MLNTEKLAQMSEQLAQHCVELHQMVEDIVAQEHGQEWLGIVANLHNAYQLTNQSHSHIKAIRAERIAKVPPPNQ